MTCRPPPTYTLDALLSVAGNFPTSPLFNKIFNTKGVYRTGKGVNYNGSYYDALKDEFTDNNLVLVVPERLRSQLRDGQLIEVSVYLSNRFQAGSGRIDVLLTLNKLLARKEKVIDEQATKALDLLQNKAKAGYKDADSFIRKRLFEQKPVRVTIIVGQGAIVDQDIKHQGRAGFNGAVSYLQMNSLKQSPLPSPRGEAVFIGYWGGAEKIKIKQFSMYFERLPCEMTLSRQAPRICRREASCIMLLDRPFSAKARPTLG